MSEDGLSLGLLLLGVTCGTFAGAVARRLMAGGGTGRGNRSAWRQVRLLVLLFGVAYVVIALLWLLGYRRWGLAVSNATLILLIVLVLIVARVRRS